MDASGVLELEAAEAGAVAAPEARLLLRRLVAEVERAAWVACQRSRKWLGLELFLEVPTQFSLARVALAVWVAWVELTSMLDPMEAKAYQVECRASSLVLASHSLLGLRLRVVARLLSAAQMAVFPEVVGRQEWWL